MVTPMQRNRPDEIIQPEERLLVRARMDPKSNTEYDPTRVLFIRGLSTNVTEREVVDICSEVGIVLQVFLLKNKGQAFVELDSIEAADFCLLHFTRNVKIYNGNQLFFSYSGRTQVTRRSHDMPRPSPELVLTITRVCYPNITFVWY